MSLFSPDIEGETSGMIVILVEKAVHISYESPLNQPEVGYPFPARLRATKQLGSENIFRYRKCRLEIGPTGLGSRAQAGRMQVARPI
jgi:hypothetical protein